MGKHHVYKLAPLPSGQRTQNLRSGLRNVRRQCRRRQGRARRKQTPRRDLGPAAPPALSMMSNQCSLWLRTVQKLAFKKDPAQYNESWNPTITTLVGDPWNILSDIFAEIKVLRINIYLYTRNTNLTSSGIHTLVVTDKDEIYETNRSFISTSSAPGAVTRRITQPLHGTWFPTEPSDRAWTIFNDAAMYTNIAYAIDGVTLPLEFDLFFDVHCRFRGLKHPASVTDLRSVSVQLAASINDVCLESGPSSIESSVSLLG